jgi:hypothetical protein
MKLPKHAENAGSHPLNNESASLAETAAFQPAIYLDAARAEPEGMRQN